MPTSVIAAVVGSYVTGAVAGSVIGGVVIGTIGSSIIGGLASAGTSMLLGAAFSDGGDESSASPAPQFEQELRDNLVTVRQPITHWQYIYGRTRVGGALTFAHESADDNLHLVITYAGHVCQEIEAVQFNDEVVPLDGSGSATGRYAGYVLILKSLGDEAGQPFPNLVADSEGKWTDAHRQSGRTKIYVRLTPNADLFPTGIPNITCVIKGKKCYDPRTGLTVWTDNASLCIADFLCDTTWIGATYASEIDATQLIAAANIDDEYVLRTTADDQFGADDTTDEIYFFGTVKLPAVGDGVRVSSTGALPAGLSAATTYYAILAGTQERIKLATTHANALAGTPIDITDAGSGTHTLTRYSEPRYTLNGSFSVNIDSRSVLGRMLTANAGRVHYIGGVFRILPAAYVSPTITFTEADLRGVPQIEPRLSASDSCNGVKGVYVSEDNLWQASDFPPVTNATYLTEDGEERSWRELDLPFTKSAATAQRIAKIELERARQQISVAWPGKLTCYRAQPGDVQQFTFAMLGWSAKAFEVVGGGLTLEADSEGQPTLGSDLALRETASSVFDWSSGEETEVDPAPDTNLPDPWTVATPGNPAITEELYETRDGRGVAAKAIVTWGNADPFAKFYQLEYKLSSAGTYAMLPLTTSQSAEVLDIAPGIYDFRVKTVNQLGVSSAYGTTANKEIVGLGARPAAPTGLTIQAIGGQALLTFTQHPDLDVKRGGRILVRHCEDTASPSWETSFSIGNSDGYQGDSVYVLVPLKAGTYLLKAEDSIGNQSSSAATITTRQASVLTFSSVGSVTESPTFPGTHSNTVLDGATLKLTGAGLFDDIADFDSISSLDDYGGVNTSGTYTFSAGIDLGSVDNVRLTGAITGLTVNVNDKFDDRSGSIDGWLDFDGTAGGGSVDAYLECRQTDDNPAGAPTWTGWTRLDAAEKRARAFQFRLQLLSNDVAYNEYITALAVTAEQVV